MQQMFTKLIDSIPACPKQFFHRQGYKKKKGQNKLTNRLKKNILTKKVNHLIT